MEDKEFFEKCNEESKMNGEKDNFNFIHKDFSVIESTKETDLIFVDKDGNEVAEMIDDDGNSFKIKETCSAKVSNGSLNYNEWSTPSNKMSEQDKAELTNKIDLNKQIERLSLDNRDFREKFLAGELKLKTNNAR